MKLLQIEKEVYRQRLNRVILGFIIVLAILAVGFGTLLIEIFSPLEAGVLMQEGSNTQSSNFKFNFLGVIMAVLACAAILHSLKTTTYFHEIYYVWQLKQIQNKIYRKLKTIKKQAFENDNHNALVILSFYYHSLKQVYQLDDNTLTITTVNRELEKLKEFLEMKDITIEHEHFDQSMIASC